LEAEVMANDRPNETSFDIASTSDHPEPSDSLSKGLRLVEQSRQEIARLRALLDKTNQLVAELGRATAAFESVADDLVAATLHASSEATGAGTGRRPPVALVEELAALARRSLLASSDGRRNMRAYLTAHKPTAAAEAQAHSTLDALAALLRRLGQQAAEREAVPVIVVEAPPPPVPESATSRWRTTLAAAVRDADPAKPRRYKN
jgi:sorbitol-specific phosphotransferase system component IIA